MKKARKIMSAVLAAAMVLTMTAMMSACGEDESSGNKVSSKDQTSENASNNDSNPASGGSVFPAALANVQAYPVSELQNTGWELTGGMVDGVEMEQSDVNELLQSCGGTLQFVFTDESAVIMVNGEKNFDGTYEIIQDDYAIHATFTGYEYYGVFTKIDEQTIMILANKSTPETALYMTQIDEH